MNKLLLVLVLLPLSISAQSQQWIDTLYSIETFNDVEYGSQIDFAGNERLLKMDISLPANDSIPPCGRPLLVAIHGGAFITGNKEAAVVRRLREDYAKRGYVTASISYRLGMFQPENQVHCNVEGWDCFNVADTSEWSRALYRGMQDTKGALRFLINRADEYQIDAQNVFLVGESAGGFIALATAFWNEPSEVPADIQAFDPLNPPHPIYEGQCIQGLQLDTSIASLQLDRPDLGPPDGPLNPSETDCRIRGVGSFYGGMMGNYFELETDTVFPALYLFHQPNDLIVPFNYGRVVAGYVQCAISLAGCGYIVNRPYVYGGRGVANLIDTLVANGQPAPDYLFEQTNNNADCLIQLINPSLAGHALDNYWIRSGNMAAYFASYLDLSDDCIINALSNQEVALRPMVYPNPTEDLLTIEMLESTYVNSIRLISLSGNVIHEETIQQSIRKHVFSLNSGIVPGMYLLVMETANGLSAQKVIFN